jgi:DNA-binding NarL/FixJ family response regulator
MSGGRVVVADDDVLLREGVVRILGEAGYEVVAQAGDGTELERLAREHLPDLAVVDIRMPPTNTTEGIEAAEAIRGELPEIGILLLSAHVEVETATDLLNGGERIGYLLKSRVLEPGDLVDALDHVARGGSIVDPALVQELLSSRRRHDPLDELTPRECDVLALMAEGRSNSGIARKLWVTEGAVEKHVRSILRKLGLPEAEDDHRRVLAVLTYLESR